MKKILVVDDSDTARNYHAYILKAGGYEVIGAKDGAEALEIHADAFKAGDRVLIVDDILASGGTAVAARRLVERTGAQPLALTLFIEVDALQGRTRLEGLPVFSVLRA